MLELMAGLGNPGTSSAFVESYTYDAIGELAKKTQRTGSVHQYSYDTLGRMTVDNAITLGSGVANNIRRQQYSFNGIGQLYQSTSFSNTNGTGTPVNQIQRDYNGLGQITREWQNHSGSVTTNTTSVQYTYSEMAGGANHSQLTGIIYPDGTRTVVYDYSGNNGLDDVISRLSKLTMGTNTLESYDYLGLSTVVKKAHPQNGIDLTYENNANDTLAGNDGGDQYSGLDRFGRVVDQWWMKDNGGTNVATSNDRFQYGYDRNSNVMYKNNLGPTTNAASFSELYHTNGTNGAYDNLNRLTDFRRGVLSKSGGSSVYDTITTSSSTRNWSLDAQGNWSQNSSGDNYAVNQQNQYTSLSSGTNALNYGYDNDGNMTTRVDHSGFGCSCNYVADTFTYDAWDRMASFTHTVNPGNTITETDFNYDGLVSSLC